MAVHPKEELLVHVLDPSRSVEGNFRVYTAKLLDGRVLQGMLASESRTAVEVIDAEGKKHSVLREDIESLAGSARSLMPEGFEKQASRKDLTDLLEFLTRKGKYLPLPLDKVATVVTTRDMFFDAGGQAERLVFPDWKPKAHNGVPFVLVDPQGDRVKNAVMLHGPNGVLPPRMPKVVTLPVNGRAKAVHLLGGVGGWSARAPRPDGPVSLTVRVHYDDGKAEDHPLRDGVHLADYSRRVDVPGSEFAFQLGDQQVRYLAVTPKRPDAVVKSIELVKGTDGSAPVVLAVTVEAPE
jgi:putative heme-binding domain-containing protein